MDKVMVNGPDTSPVYRYLKDVTDSGDLTWNFGAYFLIGTDGTITRHESRGWQGAEDGITPIELAPEIEQMRKMAGTKIRRALKQIG